RTTLRKTGDLDPAHARVSAAGSDWVGDEVLEEEVRDVGPVLVGDPVRSTLELEQVVLASAVFAGQIGRLAREHRVLVAPHVEHRRTHRCGVGSLGTE